MAHDHETGGPVVVPGRLDPAEVVALRAAIGAFLARTGHHSRTLVARAAEALDDLRDELDHTDRLIAEQQDRIRKLYKLFTGWEGDSG